MKLMTTNQFFIFLLLYFKNFSLIVYFKFQLFYVDDYIDYIISSEGKYTPTNAKHNKFTERSESYTFNFNYIKHNFKEPLCMYFVNLVKKGRFAFKYATINEYDITIVDYEKYYFCNNCNINTAKKFKTSTEKYSNGSPKILISEYDKSIKIRYNTFCLNKTNDISIFYVNENKINEEFYKGKNVKYILNNEVDNFNINNCFVINGNEDYIFDIDAVSFKIIKITNKNGNIFNYDEELSKDSFFNAKKNYLIHKKINDEGYLMIISIVTKPRNKKSLSISTCENESNIYLYVAQKNCTMNEFSDNYCQNCKEDYGKYENNCYHKSEKFVDLYYDSSSKIWNKCESNKNNFICSICPKGTYIKDNFNNICEKCQKGEFGDTKNKIRCEKCSIGYYTDEIGSINCKKCPDGYTSLIGSDKCYKVCDPGYYPNGDKCLPCKPGYYSLGSSIECSECIVNKYSLFGFSECLSCEETIPYCNACSKEGICLECNNGAINGFSNCTICENEIDWKFTGEFCQLITICPKYFYKDKINNNKINCIEDINDCPEGMNYLNLDTKECLEKQKVSPQDFINFHFKVKGGEDLLKEISDDIFEYIEFDDLYEEIIKRYKIKIEGKNVKLQIGSEEILKKQVDSDIGIDLGDCPDKIRFNLGQQNNNELIYKVFEITFKGTKIVKYYIYDPNDLETPLDLKECEGQKIKIINPPSHNDYEFPEEFYNILNIINNNIDIYNAYSPLYTDPCFPLSVLNKYDIILRDRRSYINKYKIPLCEKGCEYEGENLKKLQVICYCPIKTDMNQNLSLNNFINDTKNYVLGNNFKVLKCYKLNFSLKGQNNNYFSELFIFFFIMNILLIIIIEIYFNKNLNNLIVYCKDFINKKNNDNKKFKAMININSNKKNDIEIIKIEKRFRKFIKEKMLNNPPKKNSKNENIEFKIIDIEKITKDNNIEKFVNSIILIRKKYIKFELFKKINSIEKYQNYYVYLIFAYIKKERKKFLIEDELINLEYDYYRHIEDRKWYIIFLSMFKLNYDFTNTFLIYNNSENYKNYQMYSIKIIIYINCLMISIISNLIFYSDETMHKIYIDNGEYNFIYRLPIIVLSDIIMKVFSVIFEKLVNFQDDFIELKINLNRNEFENKKQDSINNTKNINTLYNNILVNNYIYTITCNEGILNKKTNTLTKNELNNNEKIINNSKINKEDISLKKIENNFRNRRIIFYSIIIPLNLFSWYYISCFCSVYEITQKYLLYDFLYGIPINFIKCFVFTIIYFLIKIFIIKGKYSNIKRGIIKICDNNYIKIAIEEIIEIVMIPVIKKIHDIKFFDYNFFII